MTEKMFDFNAVLRKQLGNQFRPKPKRVVIDNTEVIKKMRMNNNTSRPTLVQNRPDQNKRKLTVQEQRRKLPIFSVKDRLINLIKKHSTLIVMAETGSGKTTQVAHFIDSARLQNPGKIAVTQPRKVAAISVANRVTEEYGKAEKVGGVVGYTVRFEDVTSNRTRVKFLTDGMLLREAMFDKLLLDYTFVILDEAHERTIHTDVLFGIVKNAQKVREARNLAPLKIIVMSATMDVERFRKYFNDCQAVYVEGRNYPVELFNVTQPQDDYQSYCIRTFFKIHREAPANHDVLMFLTGQDEIESAAHQIRLLAKTPDVGGPPIHVFTLYAAQSNQQQMAVFAPTPTNSRKLVIATNIAETSLTLSGIKYVIDCGMVKTRTYHPATGLEVLKVQPISQEQANQRAGRAGRESNGFCYRIYTKAQYEMLQKSTVPEIQRSNVTSVALQLLSLKIHMLYFDFMDKPPENTIKAAFEQLKLLGAVDNATSNTLTTVGKQMAKFPIDPKFSKLLVSSQDFGCLEEALTMVAILSSEGILVNPTNKKDEAEKARERFRCPNSDHITLLNIYRAYLMVQEHNRKKWCKKHFIHARNIDHATKIRSQLEEICKRGGFVFKSCDSNMEQFRKCLLSGLFMNVAEFCRDYKLKNYHTLEKRQITYIHPSSVIHSELHNYIVFTEVVQTTKCYLRVITQIEPQWLLEVAPEYVKERRHNFNHFKCKPSPQSQE